MPYDVLEPETTGYDVLEPEAEAPAAAAPPSPGVLPRLQMPFQHLTVPAGTSLKQQLGMTWEDINRPIVSNLGPALSVATPFEVFLPEKGRKGVEAFREALGEILGGFTSPLMLGIGRLSGGLSATAKETTGIPRVAAKFAQRLIAAGFTEEMVRGMGPAAEELATALVSGDEARITKAAVHAASNVAFAVGAGHYALRPPTGVPVRRAAAAAPVTPAPAAAVAPKAEVPSAVQVSQAAEVLRDVPQQPRIGAGEVPAPKGPERVPRGVKAEAAAGKPEVPVAPAVTDAQIEVLAQKGADPKAGRFTPEENALLGAMTPEQRSVFLERQMELKAKPVEAVATPVSEPKGITGSVSFETYDEPSGQWETRVSPIVVSRSTIPGDKPWRATVFAGSEDSPVAIGHIQLDSPGDVYTPKSQGALAEQLGRYVRNIGISEARSPVSPVAEAPVPTEPLEDEIMASAMRTKIGAKVPPTPPEPAPVSPAPAPVEKAAPAAPADPISTLSSAPAVKVTLPKEARVLPGKGTPAIRGTDAKGRTADQPASVFAKGNPFQGAGIVKVEPGYIDRATKKFVPVKGDVEVALPAARVPRAPKPKAAPVVAPAAPEAAAAKVEAEVAKQTPIEATAAKKTLVSELNKALETAPKEADLTAEQKAALEEVRNIPTKGYKPGKGAGEAISSPEQMDALLRAVASGLQQVSIDIPGDGRFSTWNVKEILEPIRDAAKRLKTSRWEEEAPEIKTERGGETVRRRRIRISQEDFSDALTVYGTAKNAYEKLSDQLSRADELELPPQQRARMAGLLEKLKTRAENDARAVRPVSPPGPGAQTVGEAPYAAAQQLADQLRATPSYHTESGMHARLQQVADKWAANKPTAARALARLQAVGESVRRMATGTFPISGVDQALGRLDYALQRSASESTRAGNALRQQMRNVDDRSAAALWIESGGDPQLIRWTIDNLPAETPAYVRRALERAENPTPEVRELGESLRQYFGIRMQDAQAADLFEQGLEDYYTHIWRTEDNMPSTLRGALGKGSVTDYFRFGRHRKIPTLFEGILQGKKPVLDPADVVPYYNHAMDRAIAGRQFVSRLSELKASDGLPVVEPTGVGRSLPAAAPDKGVILISPKAKPGDIAANYERVDHPSLRKWKWAASTEDGKPILLQGDLVVHKEFVKRLQRMMDRSFLTPGRAMRRILAVGGEVKAAKLASIPSAFHTFHVGTHALWHWTNPFFRVGEINWESPEVIHAVEKGHLKLAASARDLANFGEGIIGTGLVHKVPILGPWSKAYGEWLFGDYIPALKLRTYQNALSRNMRWYAKDIARGKLTADQVAARVGDSVNNAYGELNHLFLGRYGRDPRFQRLLRAIFLAPDFGEARLRFASKVFTKYGGEERLAIGTMFIALYLAARIGNTLSHGNPEWDFKRMFQVKAGDHWWGMRSVVGDVAHLFTSPRQFVYARLNPVYSRTLADLVFGRDVGTARRLGPTEYFTRLLDQVIPIQFGGLTREDQRVWESFSASMGVSAMRDTPEMDMKKLAANWVQEKGYGAPAEFVPTDTPSYGKLRQAIRIGSPRQAMKVLRELRKTHTQDQINEAMEGYLDYPFTGSTAHEQEFVASLTPDQARDYLKALQGKQRDFEEYIRIVAMTK